MKKLQVAGALAALPFLLVWIAFILTGFNFNPHEVFSHGAFWGVSGIYWFMYIMMIGFIMEAMDEDAAKPDPVQKHIDGYPTKLDDEQVAWIKEQTSKIKPAK